MKLLFCLNKDIYCEKLLRLALLELNGYKIKIYFSKKVGKRPQIEDLDQLNSFETKNAFIDTDFLSEKNIEIIDFININQDGLRYLEIWQPDLIISVRFGQIFKQQVINLPKHGVINLHSGILPYYRGIMATFWAMLNGDKKIGTTLHFILDSGIDTGNIIDIAYLPIDPTKSMSWHILQLYFSGSKMIIEAVRKLQNNLPIKSTKQDSAMAKYFSYPTKQNIDDFKKNYRLI